MLSEWFARAWSHALVCNCRRRLQQMRGSGNKHACRVKADSLGVGAGGEARQHPLHTDNTISLSCHARPPIRANCAPFLCFPLFHPPHPPNPYSFSLLAGRPHPPSSSSHMQLAGLERSWWIASGRIRQRTRRSLPGPRDKGAGLTLSWMRKAPFSPLLRDATGRDVNTFRQVFLRWFILCGEGPRSRAHRTIHTYVSGFQREARAPNKAAKDYGSCISFVRILTFLI